MAAALLSPRLVCGWPLGMRTRDTLAGTCSSAGMELLSSRSSQGFRSPQGAGMVAA